VRVPTLSIRLRAISPIYNNGVVATLSEQAQRFMESGYVVQPLKIIGSVDSKDDRFSFANRHPAIL
jgi:hypothetical protein